MSSWGFTESRSFSSVHGDRGCMPCKKKNKDRTATLFCKTCEERQYENCSKAHDVYSFMSGHELVDLSDISSTQPNQLYDYKQHGLEDKMLCERQGQLCCSEGLGGGDNNSTGLRKVGDIRDDIFVVAEIESTIRQLLETACKSATVLKENRSSISENRCKTLEYIEDVKQLFMDKFDKLKCDINKHSEFAEEMLFAEFSRTRDIFYDLKRWQDHLASPQAHKTKEQTLITPFSCKQRLSEYKEILEDKKAILYKFNHTVSWSETLIQSLDLDRNLASFIIDKENIDPCSTADEPAVQLTPFISTKIKKMKDSPLEPLYTGIDFLYDGRIAVIDKQNSELLVMNEHLERKGMFRFSGYRLDVIVVSEEELVVTGGEDHIIEFLHVSKTCDITLTSRVKTTSRYTSVCLMDQTTLLACTVDDIRPFRMITLTGQEVFLKFTRGTVHDWC